MVELEGECKCQVKYRSEFTKHFETFMLILAIGLAAFTTIFVLNKMFN